MTFIGKQNKTVNDYINQINREKTWANDDLNLDDHYVFNKEYLSENLSIFKDLKPSFLLQFGIILPFDLPFTTKEFSLGKILEPNNKCMITYIFTNIEENASIYAGFLPTQKCEYKLSKTRCEITVSFQKPRIQLKDKYYDLRNEMDIVKQSKKGNVEGEKFLSAVRNVFSIFKDIRSVSVINLNSMIMAYSMLANDLSVKPVSLDDIEFISHFRGIVVSTWETFNWMIFNNTEKFPEEKKENVSDQIFAQSMAVAHEFTTNNFSNYHYHIQIAKYALSQGNKVSAIVQMNTATEILIISIITLYWENEDNLSMEEANLKIDDTPFKKMLISIIQIIIGGRWDITAKDTAFSQWFAHSYSLRNRIVHVGYRPSEKEIFRAINSSFEFHDYVVGLMVKSKYNYLQEIARLPKVKIIDMNTKKE